MTQSSHEPGNTTAAERGRDLQQRFLGAAWWMTISRFGTGLASIGITFVMARLLLPQDYGLLQMATVVTGLLSMAQSLGAGTALIQKQHVTRENEQAAFTVALAVSSALCVAIVLSAPLVAAMYADPRVTPILRVVALSFPLNAFTVVPAALLHRNLQLKGNAVTSVIAMIAESTVMLVLAWLGFGVWSLVAGQLVQVVATAAGLAWYCPWSVGLRLRGGEIRSIATFGGGVTVSAFLWYGYQNADFFIVGQQLGPAALGVYSMAWKLAKMPWERLWQAVTPVLLPLYSRAKDEPGELANVLKRLSRFTALVTVPAVAGLGAVGHDAVPLFLGDRWREASAPLAWLSAYMAIRSILALLPFILMAVGRLRQEVAFNTICAFVMPIAFVIGVQWGATGVAVAWALAWPAAATSWLIPKALDAAGLSVREWLGSMVRPITATALMLAAVTAAGMWLPLEGAWRLGVRVGLGVAVYLAAIRVLEGSVVQEFKTGLAGIRQGMRQ